MPVKRDESFPGKCRLRRSNDFRRVFHRGSRASTRYYVIITLPNRLEHSRLGIQVKRRIGNAAQRNRIKRQVRECFRRVHRDFRESLDLIVIAEQAMAKMSSAEFDVSFRASLQRYFS